MSEQCSEHMHQACVVSMCTEHVHGRTDERTDLRRSGPHQPDDTSSSVTRGRTYGFSDLADLVFETCEILGDSNTRDKVIRSGEREPIEPIKRFAIYARDGFVCQWCANGGPNLNLDHIIAWSAGGSDRSDNLRTLCQWCNEARSNRLTDNFSRVLPVTSWCGECAREAKTEDMVAAFCSHCMGASWVPEWRVL